MFGFTRNETTVLLFLIFSFIAGIGVWAFKHYLEPLPEYHEAHNVRETVLQRNDSQKETIVRGSEEGEVQVQVQNVYINDADITELERLPGIGPIIAKRIVEYRSNHGKFQTLEALMEVKGIGQKNSGNSLDYTRRWPEWRLWSRCGFRRPEARET